MLERQPGRPTVEVFTGAALRYIKRDYSDWEDLHLPSPIGVQVVPYSACMRHDQDIIMAERRAEGLGTGGELLRDFAINQLIWYRRIDQTSEDVL